MFLTALKKVRFAPILLGGNRYLISSTEADSL